MISIVLGLVFGVMTIVLVFAVVSTVGLLSLFKTKDRQWPK